MEIRQPAVAGTFYSDDRDQLTADLTLLLKHADSEAVDPSTIKALVVPHAGYIYSGSVAAAAYRLVRQRHDQIKRVILLGPSHRVPLSGMAIPTNDAFRTPLGDVTLDSEALAAIGRMPEVAWRDDAHQWEHSLEVQLPFLQTILDDFTLVPVVVGDTTADAVLQVLRSLWGGDETLVVVSSDLSHFLSYEQARETDSATTRLIENKQDILVGSQACGCYPLNGLLRLASQTGLEVVTLDQRNSGDTAGSRAQVVGYGSYAFCQ